MPCTVSTASYDKIKDSRWYGVSCDGQFYAYKTVDDVKMHDVLCPVPVPDGCDVDHFNRMTLDNRDENLRPATKSQQCMNRRKSEGKSSIFKGVCFHKTAQRWWAYIDKDYERVSLGMFDDEITAALAYDAAAIELHGEFAATNAMLGLLPDTVQVQSLSPELQAA